MGSGGWGGKVRGGGHCGAGPCTRAHQTVEETGTFRWGFALQALGASLPASLPPSRVPSSASVSGERRGLHLSRGPASSLPAWRPRVRAEEGVPGRVNPRPVLREGPEPRPRPGPTRLGLVPVRDRPPTGLREVHASRTGRRPAPPGCSQEAPTARSVHSSPTPGGLLPPTPSGDLLTSPRNPLPPIRGRCEDRTYSPA